MMRLTVPALERLAEQAGARDKLPTDTDPAAYAECFHILTPTSSGWSSFGPVRGTLRRGEPDQPGLDEVRAVFDVPLRDGSTVVVDFNVSTALMREARWALPYRDEARPDVVVSEALLDDVAARILTADDVAAYLFLAVAIHRAGGAWYLDDPITLARVWPQAAFRRHLDTLVAEGWLERDRETNMVTRGPRSYGEVASRVVEATA